MPISLAVGAVESYMRHCLRSGSGEWSVAMPLGSVTNNPGVSGPLTLGDLGAVVVRFDVARLPPACFVRVDVHGVEEFADVLEWVVEVLLSRSMLIHILMKRHLMSGGVQGGWEG